VFYINIKKGLFNDFQQSFQTGHILPTFLHELLEFRLNIVHKPDSSVLALLAFPFIPLLLFLEVVLRELNPLALEVVGDEVFFCFL